MEESEKEEFELNENRLSKEDYSLDFLSFSNILSAIFVPIRILLNLISFRDSIITYFKRKQTIQKNLNQFNKKINDEKKLFNYYFYEPLGKIEEDSTKKIEWYINQENLKIK